MFQQDYGVINYILINLGLIDHKIPWLVDPTNALIAVIVTNIWIGIPFSMAVFHS
jgi:multiple sugar transport system permease protein